MRAPVRLSLLAGLAAAMAILTPAAAQDVIGRDWSGACTGCHGTEGRSTGAIPAIAGIDKIRFVELMTAFRNGTEQTTIMHQLASGLSEEQIDAIGEYFASRSPQ